MAAPFAGSNSSSSSNPGGEGEENGSKLSAAVRKILTKVVVLRTELAALVRFLRQRLRKTMTVAFLVNCLLLGVIAKEATHSFTNAVSPKKTPIELPYSSFMDHCEARDVRDVRIGSGKVYYKVVKREKNQRDAAGSSYSTRIVHDSTIPDMISMMRKNKIAFEAATASAGSTSERGELITAVLALCLFHLWTRMLQGGGSGNGGTSSSSSSPGKLGTKHSAATAGFEGIEGVDRAKRSVLELVDTLRHPEKYSLVGARAPTGLLLEGPPGTGKTSLARACAVEAGVPLLHCSGSEFTEVYVGRGAARVRQLFDGAGRIGGPCIIFIDEIDALGKRRGRGDNNDEAEQTLNQLLACMDGMESNQICILGATNRRDVIDPALLRPGRFDRIVTVDLPDAAGRERILRVHCRKLHGFRECSGVEGPNSLGKGRAVDLSAVAAVTVGLSGADLELIVNEAAIRCVRRVSAQIDAGVHVDAIDNAIYPRDFERSVASFFESRGKKKEAMSI
jgi:cell division protease FtsH